MKEPCVGEVHQSVGGLMMAGLMLALFTAALDSTVVATALPTISAALGGVAHYAWPMTAYLASSTVSTLLCGGLAFHFGLKRTYTFGPDSLCHSVCAVCRGTYHRGASCASLASGNWRRLARSRRLHSRCHDASAAR